MNRKTLALIGGIAAVALARSEQPALAQTAADPAPFRSIGTYTASNEGPTEWFEMWNSRMRFVVDRKDRDQVDKLVEIINASNEQGRSMHVIYDPSRARFNAEARRLEYPICSVTFNEQSFQSAHPCGPASRARTPSSKSPESLVATALALGDSWEPATAVPLLDQAISTGMDATLLAIALKARAEALNTLAAYQPAASAAGDALYLRALQDFRRLDQLEPGSISTKLDIGDVLQSLGDYDAGEAVYAALSKESESDDFRVTLTQSALARAAGKPQRSLDLLNGLIERHGAQENMRFLYHRGWTLTDLARFDEAIADFTNGIRSQPDYPYAYIRRACAYGRIGRLDYAIADLETAAGLIRDVYGTKDPNVRADLQRATANAATLKAMGTANAPTSIACEGYSGEVPKPRPKSPLLNSAT